MRVFQKLDRALQSIGMECFVTFFHEFDNDELSNEEVAEMLTRDRGYTEKSCQNRTRGARRIIRAGRAKDALINVSKSSRVPPEIAAKAKRLAERGCRDGGSAGDGCCGAP